MNILEAIVRTKQQEVASRKAAVKISSFREEEYYHRTPLSLQSSVREHAPIGIIAEIKRASPSGGIFRKNAEPVPIARDYEGQGAAGISVLTDGHYFSGSLLDLHNVRKAVDVPVLRKDFIIDEFQLHEAKAHGADAILLIASILERNQIRDLFLAAREIGLEPLVELYEPPEIDILDLDVMRFIGINNRNLRTMQVDIRHSLEIVRQLPAGITLVSESGISSPLDLQSLRKGGVHGALIGEYFMKSDHPGNALRNMLDSLNDESQG